MNYKKRGGGGREQYYLSFNAADFKQKFKIFSTTERTFVLNF